ncbi:GGDEF domain-containing protein [Marinicella sediminis]|uniref:diguanylate cyclase n=1 Tax=Marinicella sediminis TaxID=1792834 RepID=A0ABV7JAG6_9GAMM|nr:GGDEF domain-containing protein [Marinicella sediminis]
MNQVQPAAKNNHQGFPDYLGYQAERLIPVARIILSLSLVYLIGFLFIDYFRYPALFEQILLLRVLAALPLLLLLRLIHRQHNHRFIPLWFLSLGLLSFVFFLALNLLVPEKKDIVVLVPVFYVLAVMAMAPLFTTGMLLVFFLVGFLIYYWCGYFFIADHQLVGRVFPHMTAIIVFTVISVIKIKQSAEEHYQLAKNLHWQSHHDPLTGALNRTGMFAWLKEHGLFTSKTFEPVSLAMLDLDHFKRINDEYGHDVGDLVIKQSAQLIERNLSQSSRLARFGGEEFLLVLLEGSDGENLRCANQILQHFREWLFKTEDGSVFGVTASIGFVNHRQPNSFTESLKEADDLLYQAKAQGRDQLQDGHRR